MAAVKDRLVQMVCLGRRIAAKWKFRCPADEFICTMRADGGRMLNRQKTLLQLLKTAGRPVQKTELTKWSFLLRHEYASGGGSSFYDFVPYRFGPFSFCLYQEVGKLEGQGLVATIESSTSQNWRIADDADFVSPSEQTTEDIGDLVHEFGRRNLSSLVNYVYERYPAYTCNSEIRKLVENPVAEPAVYTAGYEGISVDAFFNMLVRCGIRRLVDVRNNPVARRYGFHKSTLTRLANSLGMDYVHFPQLGILSPERQGLDTTEAYAALFLKYTQRVVRTQLNSIKIVGELMADKPSVLICMESDPSSCHRSHLAEEISELTDLPIVHLRPTE
jgi:uncharacterized protein (DUF488 family)